MSEPVEIVRAADLVGADPTPGMSRFRAFEAAGLWAGRVVTDPGPSPAGTTTTSTKTSL